MLCMKVSLGTMGARKLSVSILLRDDSILRGTSAGGSCGPTWGTGQNSAPSLGSYYMGRLFGILEQRWLVTHHRASTIRRGHSGLGDDSTSGHGPENWRPRSSWRRCNRLRVRSCNRSLRHHRRGRRIALRGILILTGHHTIRTTARTCVRRRVVAHILRLRRAGSTWRPRRMRVAPVDRLHAIVMLQRG